MQINFGNNVNIEKSQIGDGGVMIVEASSANVPENYWKELNEILVSLINQKNVQTEQHNMAQEALHYVENRDTQGFSAFIKKNKHAFITNILSDVASSGLMLLLSKL